MMEDLEEWEILPKDGLLQIHDDGGKKIFSRKFTPNNSGTNLFKNYFMCPSAKQSPKFVETTETDVPAANNKRLIPVPIRLPEPNPASITKSAGAEGTESALLRGGKIACPADQDPVSQSQVFFKKETEFVDMKMDSPKSNNSSNWGIHKPQMVQFEEEKVNFEVPSPENKAHQKEEEEEDDDDINIKKGVNWDDNSGGLNGILKWGFTGIGAICSFGVATVCIFVVGAGLVKNNGNGIRKNPQNHKLQFHIYAQDKRRLKQVVEHEAATRLNEAAMSAEKGVALSRAQITCGGYYDGGF